jgi:hypothetical protein
VPLCGEEELLRCDGGFSITGDNPASRAHKPFTPSGHVTLHTVQLDAFVRLNDIKFISFIKVDVEGFDTFVMEGAEQLFKTQIIYRAVVEVTSHVWGVQHLVLWTRSLVCDREEEKPRLVCGGQRHQR